MLFLFSDNFYNWLCVLEFAIQYCEDFGASVPRVVGSVIFELWYLFINGLMGVPIVESFLWIR